MRIASRIINVLSPSSAQSCRHGDEGLAAKPGGLGAMAVKSRSTESVVLWGSRPRRGGLGSCAGGCRRGLSSHAGARACGLRELGWQRIRGTGRSAVGVYRSHRGWLEWVCG